ncbi:WG containing repeat-containing protein [Arenibacter nanhaiticus]|uniref:WG containing repeat-containing protein n=1 Tax=Arenibacter nanhaiticus TaxID=558155 RepID=A0A1M6JC60_9FLAO|nr:WG repeat-containing protein [Arenibacter nanhaiticus]SHJ44202.1 WG containing repeat-containing protein [Arenibacter nanhaiticus]
MKRLHFFLAMLLTVPFFMLGQMVTEIDEIAPFSEGLSAVRKGNQWGFIDKKGALVIDFRNDLHWTKDAKDDKLNVLGVRYPMFRDGRCMIKKMEDGIPLFGFIDTKGNIVVAAEYLNIYPFENGKTTGVLFDKTLKGENEFKLKIYEFKFHDVLLDSSGEILEFYTKRDNIQMTKKRYKTPFIGAKIISKDLIAVWVENKGWEIRTISP